MRITAVKQQVKQQGGYSIFVEGKYAFSLSEVALLESKLFSGQELDERQIRDFRELSADDKLYNRALRYAVMRPRSVWEMESYLQRKSTPAPLTMKIINKLSKMELLNDAVFARSWITNRRLFKPVSRRRLVQELRTKHIADDVIQAAIAEDPADELATLRSLIVRKRKHTKYQDEAKLMQYLTRQGFSYDDIKTALQQDREEE